MNIIELSKEEAKQLLKKICSEYKIKKDLSYLIKDFRWFMTKKEQKIYIVNKEIQSILKNIKNLKVEKYGIYIAKIEKDGIRLSIEGSQIFGPFSKKSVEVNIEEVLLGKKIKIDEKGEGYYLIKQKEYFAGTLKIKNGKVLTYISKNRRIGTE